MKRRNFLQGMVAAGTVLTGRNVLSALETTANLPVHDTVAAIAFVAQARGDDLSQSAAFQRLVAWAARSSGAESLSVILWAVAVPEEGH